VFLFDISYEPAVVGVVLPAGPKVIKALELKAVYGAAPPITRKSPALVFGQLLLPELTVFTAGETWNADVCPALSSPLPPQAEIATTAITTV